MSNIVAGIGRGQMEVINDRVEKKREINTWYKNALREIDGISFQSEPSSEYYSNYWLTCLLVEPELTVTNREGLRLALESENIEARSLWKPLHLQPVFTDAPRYLRGVSEKMFNKGLCIPSGTNMSSDEMEIIVNIIVDELK